MRHVEAYRAQEIARLGVFYARPGTDHVWRVLRLLPPAAQLPPEVLSAFRSRAGRDRAATKTGYSDAELQRILAAARADVAALRDRLRPGQELLRRFDTDVSGLQPDELAAARRLAAMRDHGVDDRMTDVGPSGRQARAEQLFVTRRDVPAMLVLLVAVTGRNVETIKELPAEYRLLGELAVQVGLVKRRRGSGRWIQQATWEIGPAGRDLDHPGGLYLLLHQLMAGSRALSDDPSWFWAFWRNVRSGAEHANPFRRALTAGIEVKQWAEGHGLLGDNGLPLQIDFNRLRTSIEVRRTRRMGGHLPSAARSNTAAVLFSNYLRDDPTVRDWAQQVTGEALRDAEQQALDAHMQRAAQAGGATVDAAHTGMIGEEGPWSTCRDVSRHPATGRPCRATLLDCFHCGNCVVTAGHLPRLLALLDALDQRRQHLPEDQWWSRYGPSWAALRHDILPKFTPAQVSQARFEPGPDALLDLVEDPWEHP